MKNLQDIHAWAHKNPAQALAIAAALVHGANKAPPPAEIAANKRPGDLAELLMDSFTWSTDHDADSGGAFWSAVHSRLHVLQTVAKVEP